MFHLLTPHVCCKNSIVDDIIILCSWIRERDFLFCRGWYHDGEFFWKKASPRGKGVKRPRSMLALSCYCYGSFTVYGAIMKKQCDTLYSTTQMNKGNNNNDVTNILYSEQQLTYWYSCFRIRCPWWDGWMPSPWPRTLNCNLNNQADS